MRNRGQVDWGPRGWAGLGTAVPLPTIRVAARTGVLGLMGLKRSITGLMATQAKARFHPYAHQRNPRIPTGRFRRTEASGCTAADANRRVQIMLLD